MCRAHPQGPEPSATRLAPQAFSARVVDSLGEGFKGLEKAPAVRRRLAEGYKFQIPYPLILTGWSASDEGKREQFLEHIKIAEKNNILDIIKVFLFQLKVGDFYYEQH